jgi:hypothetical protein
MGQLVERELVIHADRNQWRVKELVSGCMVLHCKTIWSAFVKTRQSSFDGDEIINITGIM